MFPSGLLDAVAGFWTGPPFFFSFYKLLFVPLPAPWVGIYFSNAEVGKAQLKGASLVNTEREEKREALEISCLIDVERLKGIV